LLGLVALPALAVLYVLEQRRRAKAMSAFVATPLLASVAPRRPGWRRHAPYVLLALGLAALILAAARPRHAILKPVKGATVMLVNDISASMTATDVKPSRLGAAKRAATYFLSRVTTATQVGSIEFARRPVLLQSPSTDHALTRAAIASLKPGGGGTAMGNALGIALTQIRTAPKVDHKRPPGSVLLISDGAANIGVNPVMVAAQAKHQHVRIFTVSVGTANGVAKIPHRNGEVTTRVPVDPTELGQIAQASGGRAYRAPDSATLRTIYSALAKTLSHRRMQQQITGFVAGAGLLLVALGAGLSLLWFARLA
jgi:Ca-activated chloride channel family protein